VNWDPSIYIVAASITSILAGLVAFLTVAAERKHSEAVLNRQSAPSGPLPKIPAMKSVKDVLAVLVGLAAAAGAIYYFYKFVTFVEVGGVNSYLWKAVGLAAIAFVCGLVFFLGHVQHSEDEVTVTK
jgi:hypothetical protein